MRQLELADDWYRRISLFAAGMSVTRPPDIGIYGQKYHLTVEGRHLDELHVLLAIAKVKSLAECAARFSRCDSRPTVSGFSKKMAEFYKDSLTDKGNPWHQRERWPWLSAGETVEFLILSDIVNCADLFRVRLDYFTITGEKVVDHFLIGVSSPTFFGNIRRYSADPKGVYKYRSKLTSRIFSHAKGSRRTVRTSD